MAPHSWHRHRSDGPSMACQGSTHRSLSGGRKSGRHWRASSVFGMVPCGQALTGQVRTGRATHTARHSWRVVVWRCVESRCRVRYRVEGIIAMNGAERSGNARKGATTSPAFWREAFGSGRKWRGMAGSGKTVRGLALSRPEMGEALRLALVGMDGARLGGSSCGVLRIGWDWQTTPTETSAAFTESSGEDSRGVGRRGLAIAPPRWRKFSQRRVQARHEPAMRGDRKARKG